MRSGGTLYSRQRGPKDTPRRPPGGGRGRFRAVDEDGYFDEAVAARYDDTEAEQFERDEIDAIADLLAELAGGGRALEFAIGTRRVAPPPGARRGGISRDENTRA